MHKLVQFAAQIIDCGPLSLASVQRFEEKKKNLRLPDDYGVGELDAGMRLKDWTDQQSTVCGA